MKEELKIEQLENVTGGTVSEFEDIMRAISQNYAMDEISGVAAHIPGINNASTYLLKHVLKKKLGITTDISLGFAGTGVGSKGNCYTDDATGAVLTHAEVIDRIKAYGF